MFFFVSSLCVFFMCFFFCLLLLADSQRLKWIIVFGFISFLIIFFYFFINDQNIFAFIIKIVSGNGEKLIITGNGYELLYFLIELFYSLTLYLVIPFLFIYFYCYFLNIWTLQEKKYMKTVFIFFIYFFLIGAWIFFQDLAFSSWDIFYSNETFWGTSKKGHPWKFFWNFIDYQPQIENILVRIKMEITDLFFWHLLLLFMFIFIFYNVVIKKQNGLVSHFVLLVLNLVGIYYFLGGDSFFLDFLVLSASFFWYETLILSFYFFSNLKKRK